MQTLSFKSFLLHRQKIMQYHQKYHKELQVKTARIKSYLNKMNDEVTKQINDNKQGATYVGKGVILLYMCWFK